MIRARVIGTGAYLPERVLTNKELAREQAEKAHLIRGARAATAQPSVWSR